MCLGFLNVKCYSIIVAAACGNIGSAGQVHMAQQVPFLRSTACLHMWMRSCGRCPWAAPLTYTDLVPSGRIDRRIQGSGKCCPKRTVHGRHLGHAALLPTAMPAETGDMDSGQQARRHTALAHRSLRRGRARPAETCGLASARPASRDTAVTHRSFRPALVLPAGHGFSPAGHAGHGGVRRLRPGLSRPAGQVAWHLGLVGRWPWPHTLAHAPAARILDRTGLANARDPATGNATDRLGTTSLRPRHLPAMRAVVASSLALAPLAGRLCTSA